MDGHRFDDLSRQLASGVSRRTALKGLAAGLLGALGLRGAAEAQVTQAFCSNVICRKNPGVCKPGCVCCVFSNGNSRCMPPASCTGVITSPTTTTTTTAAPTTTTTTTTTAAPTTTTTTTVPPITTTTTTSTTTTSTTSTTSTTTSTTTTVAPTTTTTTTTAAPGVCEPGAPQSCYSGPAGTLGVGVCKSGTQTCNEFGTGYGPCLGEVLPGIEICNGEDNDCDGQVDIGEDLCPGGSCEGGACVCSSGTHDCAGTCYSNDDPDHCGALCERCSTAPNSTTACLNDSCGYICNEGFVDCDGLPSNGCEIDTQNDVNHCGACNAPCSLPNSTQDCNAGVCRIDACNIGYADCDGEVSNGCETDLDNDPQNCSACNEQCEPGEICSRGICLHS